MQNAISWNYWLWNNLASLSTRSGRELFIGLRKVFAENTIPFIV